MLETSKRPTTYPQDRASITFIPLTSKAHYLKQTRKPRPLPQSHLLVVADTGEAIVYDVFMSEHDSQVAHENSPDNSNIAPKHAPIKYCGNRTVGFLLDELASHFPCLDLYWPEKTVLEQLEYYFACNFEY